jgi:hypothetical protein
MLIGRIVGGRYIRVEGDGTGARRRDYFHGVAPSDLRRLDDRQLYTAAVRLHEHVEGGIGTREERANACEALAECYRERRRRGATIR